MAPAGIPAAELSHRWLRIPRLTPADAASLADDIAAARAHIEFLRT
jgi:hypothetical protein